MSTREHNKIEKDRKATENKLLDTIGQIIAEDGFEKTGINAVAARSGVSKVLIYRYFGSIEGLMNAYMQRHDFWINLPYEMPEKKHLSTFLKSMFRLQIEQMRKNQILKKLYRWELSSTNDMIDELRQQREEKGLWIVKSISKLSEHPQKEVAAMATILNAAVTYLVMLEDFCPEYNGIQLKEDAGWEQIVSGIDLLIELWISKER